MADGKYYKISKETLTAIADHTRTMAGTSKKLTPAEIAYWLGRVIYVPQGVASSGFTLPRFTAGASGLLPFVVNGAASSVMTVPIFTAVAVGEIIEKTEE